MNKLIIGIVLFCCAQTIQAQQDPQFSLNLFNYQFFNPAATALDAQPTIFVQHRSQYLGYSGNFDKSGQLKTQLVSFQAPVTKLKGNIGIVIVNDVAGAQSNKNAKLTYSKPVKISNGKLLLGISMGLYNRALNNELRPREPGDELVPAGNISQFRPDIGIGAYYENKFIFFGASANHLTQPKFNFGADNGNSTLNRTASALVGFNLDMSESIVIKPNVFVMSDFQNTSIQAGVNAFLNKKLWFGAGYRNQDAIIFQAGVNAMKNQKLKVGAAYDMVNSNANVKSASSFEVFLSYNIGQKSEPKEKPKKPIMRTPRYRH